MSDTSDLIVAVPLFECGKFKVCSLEPSASIAERKNSSIPVTKASIPSRRLNVVAFKSMNSISVGRIPIIIK